MILISRWNHIINRFERNYQDLRKFWRSIITSFPPGFFKYYYLFPEFRNEKGIEAEYFGVNNQYPRRRRVSKQIRKSKEKSVFRQLTKFDHVVRVNGVTAGYIYCDLRMFQFMEHKEVRLKEKRLMMEKNKKLKEERKNRINN